MTAADASEWPGGALADANVDEEVVVGLVNADETRYAPPGKPCHSCTVRVASVILTLSVGMWMCLGQWLQAKHLHSEPRAYSGKLLEFAAVVDRNCSGDEDDCRDTRCCKTKGAICFEKNKYWAQCKVHCVPGMKRKDSDGKAWSCVALLKDAPVKASTKQNRFGPAIVCSKGGVPKLPQYTATPGPACRIKVLSHNLEWWHLYGVLKGNGDSASHLIRATSVVAPYDFMGFQECQDGLRVLGRAGLAASYEISHFKPLTKSTALCMAYRKANWALLASGQGWVAEDQPLQYFGKRGAQWVRLRHRISHRTAFFMNYHGPLRMNSGGKCGEAITAMKLLQLVAANAKPGDAIVVVGDFNANPNTPMLNLLAQHLRHSFGNGMDNVFTNVGPAAVKASSVLGNGGSDHNALAIILELAGTPPKPAGPPRLRPTAVPGPKKPAAPPMPAGPPRLQPTTVPWQKKPEGLQPGAEQPTREAGATQLPVATLILPTSPAERPAGRPAGRSAALPAVRPSVQPMVPHVPQNPLLYLQQRP
mmetsp:Transcript_48402/g.96239  ORF Transcript_48402/g.96239 Transcript_48402/m.96239 type:complete len:534 (-) Transcript_48402:274-1875(-)